MNELMNLNDIKIFPAKVEFDFDMASKALDEVLQKYSNILVTEDTVKDNKKLIADLRKEQKAFDTTRKEIKSALTDNVKTFDKKCSILYAKFDDVINPIDKQAKDFEEAKRQEKEVKVKALMHGIAKDNDLPEKYRNVLFAKFNPSWLNSSMAISKVEDEISREVTSILMIMDKEKADLNMIEILVESKNKDLKTERLNIEAYIHYLDYTDISDVKQIIEKDFLTLKGKEEALLVKEQEEYLNATLIDGTLIKIPEDSPFVEIPFDDEEEIFIDDIPFGNDDEIEQPKIIERTLSIKCNTQQWSEILDLINSLDVYFYIS
jgi:hypothetical protein